MLSRGLVKTVSSQSQSASISRGKKISSRSRISSKSRKPNSPTQNPENMKNHAKNRKTYFFKNVYYTTGDVSGGCYEGFRVFKSTFPMIKLFEHFLRIFLLQSDQKISGILGFSEIQLCFGGCISELKGS